jgi:hypothetical protein
MYTKFLSGNLEGRYQSEDFGLGGSIIRMDVREIGWEVVDWIYLAQNKDHWRTLVKTVMNSRIPFKGEGGIS